MVSCPDNAILAEPSTSISFEPKSLTGCDGDCKYWIDRAGSLVKDTATISPSSSVSFVGEALSGQNGYKLYVKNTVGSANCNFTVDYKKPSFTCPADVEKFVDASVSVSLTGVQYCSRGCSYKVTKASTSGTEVLGSGTDSSYTSGSLGNVSESNEGKVSYYVVLSNRAGAGNACHFDVDYKARNCTQYLTQYIIDEHNQNKAISLSMSAGNCYEINTGKGCRKVRLQNSQSTGTGTFTINGTDGTCASYNDLTITQNPTITVETNSCSISGMEVYDCFDMIDPDNFTIDDWNEHFVETGTYTIKSLPSGCVGMQFRCGSDACSVGVNDGTAVTGAAYSGQNNH